MILHVLRALFVLLMASAGWFFIGEKDQPFGWLSMSVALSVAVLVICIDILSPRKKLAVFAGSFFGLLVGLLLTWGLSFGVRLIVDVYGKGMASKEADALVQFINVGVGLICCYLAISFILQTKDDFRFIIPYVEFSKQVRGARPMVIDTSIIIDGRILDIATTGMLESRLIVPRFVLQELQLLADSADKLKRNRGRRGLDVLNKLQANRKAEVILYEWNSPAADAQTTDEKLLALAKELGSRLLTTDYNLAKVAEVRGVDVINLNDLASALRPVVLPGERLAVRLLKPGEEPTQGVGFLDDGTMVVVDQGRDHLNQDVEFVVTNVLQTATGRMIFGRMGDSPAPPVRRPPKRETTATKGTDPAA